MKIATTPTNGEIPDKKDPYPYGWREAIRTLPDGTEVLERTPLTLEDILHPQVGDYRMHDPTNMSDFVTISTMYCPPDSQRSRMPWSCMTCVWPGHTLISESAWTRHCGDFQRPATHINWSTFSEAEEGTKPSLIIEIVSPSTRSVDVVKKVDHYARVGVPNYIIVDRFERRGVMVRELVGYRLTPDGYEELSPNADGWLRLEPVNLWLGLEGEDLVCYDEKRQSLSSIMWEWQRPVLRKPKPVLRSGGACCVWKHKPVLRKPKPVLRSGGTGSST